MPFLLTRKKTWERLWKNTVSSKNNSCIQGLFYKSFFNRSRKGILKKFVRNKVSISSFKVKAFSDTWGHGSLWAFPMTKSKRTFCEFFSLGGGMSRILRMAWSGGSLKNGGSPSTISITIIPEKNYNVSIHCSFLKFWIIFIDVPSDQISTSGP